MKPEHIHTLQWSQALAIARQTCARIFSDGVVPRDALLAFGLRTDTIPAADWGRTVDAIAQVLCTNPRRDAA